MGNTPAGAGKISSPARTTHPLGEHPRRRGEDIVLGEPRPDYSGTPPQARGRLQGGALVFLALGNTPAGAGKMTSPGCNGTNLGEHPRRRGEDNVINRVQVPPRGTPPQARGRSGLGRHRRGVEGSTPAGAGKIKHSNIAGQTDLGTPPQARGRFPHPFAESLCEGNTPAGAGKTRRCSGAFTRSREHPRRRGEDAYAEITGEYPEGTPPQARGRFTLFVPNVERYGNTPAGAGKMSIHRGRPSCHWEHPRRRGEDCFMFSGAGTSGGNTPAGAGKIPPRCTKTDTIRGNTPAGAGKILLSVDNCSPKQQNSFTFDEVRIAGQG